MADTAIRSDNLLTVQKWSAALFKEAMKNVFFGRFVGKSEDSIIQTKTDLTKEEGDKITFGLRMMLDGQGQGQDEPAADAVRDQGRGPVGVVGMADEYHRQRHCPGPVRDGEPFRQGR